MTGMMPLWIWLLSGFFVPEDSEVTVPYRDLALSLVLLTVPIGFGLLARRFARRLADFITNKFIKPFSFCVLVLIFGVSFTGP
jgi:solute carrier family 10 (sodium/bile acid cotransporter), member 3/5